MASGTVTLRSKQGAGVSFAIGGVSYAFGKVAVLDVPASAAEEVSLRWPDLFEIVRECPDVMVDPKREEED